MKAVFIKNDVVIGVVTFNAGNVKSTDKSVTVVQVDDDVEVEVGYLHQDEKFIESGNG